MQKIELTQGKCALVDDEDFEWLNQHKWCVSDNRGYTFYARRSVWLNKKAKSIRMHREILGLTANDGVQVDHINSNGLDNQRNNLRIATISQNHMNQRRQIGKTSKYKGVIWDKYHNKWRAQIKINNKRYHLGHFINEIEAAKAYDNKAKELFGAFANLNFKSN